MQITKNTNNLYIRLLSVSSAIIAILLIAQLFIYSTSPLHSKSEQKAIELGSRALTPAILIPESLTFSDEMVPLSNQIVRESLDRELLVNAYWQSQTLLFIKRANRYFPIIEPILKAQGVPDDFKYLALIESSFLPRAVSGSGAVGIWQFMEKTGREYGLEINKEIDERYNIEKSTIAACKYLKNAKERLGNWTLAAASYNAGQAGIDNQTTRQKNNSYYNLFLNEETSRYVYRILAAKVILSNPDKYGFIVDESEKYPVWITKEIEIKGGISDLAQFAIDNGITYKELKELNPWLRDNILSNINNKSYTIKIIQNHLDTNESESILN